MPGGLPKIDLSASLVENKWGRCASLKSGASTRERLYPWFWNPEYYFAIADGISCFKMGEEYAHGGLSLQECVTLQLTVNNNVKGSDVISVEITDIVWKGLRCTIVTDGNFTGLACDIRLQAGDPSTSAVVNINRSKIMVLYRLLLKMRILRDVLPWWYYLIQMDRRQHRLKL
jgi:hypothetical protein